MLSFSDIELMSFGAATIVDVVLLMAIIERRNWRHVVLPVALLVVGALLWHGGGFVHLLFLGVPGDWVGPVQWTSMLAMALGLGMLPCAMLHALWRMLQTGLDRRTAPNRWHALAYLPMLFIEPVAFSLKADSNSLFVDLLHAWITPYAIWLGLINFAMALGMVMARRRISDDRVRSFLRGMAVALATLAAFQSFVLLYAIHAWPQWQPGLVLAMAMSPLLPTILFAYFIVRFNVMRLALERSAIYGGMLLGIMLVHRFAFDDLREAVADRYRVDLGLIEAGLLISLVLIYRPLRRRASEALYYLMGSRVDLLRERLRRLSLELAERSSLPPRDILAWFTAAIKETLTLDFSGAWLFDSSGRISLTCGNASRLSPGMVEALYRELTAAQCVSCTRYDAPFPAIADHLETADAALAVCLHQGAVSGVVLLGRRSRNRDLGEEFTGSVILLCEQLSVTLNSSTLQIEALAAERRALQNEKLSALGLLASSITHEVKNPLSSIKTIAAVLAEELAGTEHSEDLRLILSEIDRLSATTSQLLQFARPSSPSAKVSQPHAVLSGTLHVMRHLARERGVQLEANIAETLPPVTADDAALSEIFFNLLTNSIDAAGKSGRVLIRCVQENGHVVASFQDDGPGIAPEVQDRLFEPFVTTKQAGTGLGLYAINRRVRECGGEIACVSGPKQGTTFCIRLPVASPAAPSSDRDLS